LRDLTVPLPSIVLPLSIRSLQRALVVALFAAVTAISLPLAAQQAATADQPAQASTADHSEAAGSQEASKSGASEEDVYLHAPIVRKLGQLLHLDVNTASNLFMGLNFAVIVLGVGIPLYRVVPKLLRNRGERLRTELESARKATAEAGARLSAIEAKLAGLDGEIDKIRLQVEQESKQDEARIKSTIGEESARIVAAAELEIGSAAAQARRSLRHFAADLAIDQAAKELKFTPETDRALIAEFLSDAALTGRVEGGQK